MFPMFEPKVLSVEASKIKEKIDSYLQHVRETLASYERAFVEGIKLPKGRGSWSSHITQIKREIAAYEVIGASLGAGPFTMSVAEFKTLWEHFSPYKTAEELASGKDNDQEDA